LAHLDRFHIPTGPARVVALALLLALLLDTAAGPPAAMGQTTDTPATPAVPAAVGSIAYVNAATGDEIRLVQPDGSGNRRVWAHGLADPNSVYRVTSLAWRPNAAELAFASSHENWCSLNDADIFAIAADGHAYRRITQAPSCAGLAAYPKGTVRVPVENSSILGDSFAGFVYFQGAPSILPLTLPPGGSSVLTFNNVADFGEAFEQVAVMIVPPNRAIAFETAVDVVAGQTVTTGEMGVYVPDTFWETRFPTWRSDGSSIGYVLNFASLFRLPPNPSPLDLGTELQTEPANMPDFADLLAWGPPSRANQLLYAGNTVFDSEAIYLLTEGSSGAGQKLLAYEVWEQVRGLAWLPDGSGFVFAVEEDNDSFESVRANVFEYTFATQQMKRLTNYSNLFAGQVSVSPDGTQIVFDRSAAKEPDAPADVWIMNRNGSGQRLLAANGRAPAWSPRAVPVVRRAYLPIAIRPR
jgi:TolB protein